MSTRIVPVTVATAPMHLNTYLLIDERVVIVDTGIPGSADTILDRLAEEGHSAEDVSLILLTHGHIDHAGSAEALKERTGAPIALGAGDEEKCRAGFDTEMRGRGLVGRQLLKALRARPRPKHTIAEPDLILAEETSLAPYGVDAVAVPTPGHSRGSLSVFLGSGEAVVGDLIVARVRDKRLPARGIFLCDEEAMDASIAAIVRREPPLTYASHADEPFTLDAMRTAFAKLL